MQKHFWLSCERWERRRSEDISVNAQHILLQLMSSLITRDFEHIVRTCELASWKEALAMALTYARADEFANLCGKLFLTVVHILCLVRRGLVIQTIWLISLIISEERFQWIFSIYFSKFICLKVENQCKYLFTFNTFHATVNSMSRWHA